MATTVSPDDLTIENLTPHVIKIGSDISDERLKFVFARLIRYSHDFVRETKLTTAEWEAAWQYLTEVGCLALAPCLLSHLLFHFWRLRGTTLETHV